MNSVKSRLGISGTSAARILCVLAQRLLCAPYGARQPSSTALTRSRALRTCSAICAPPTVHPRVGASSPERQPCSLAVPLFPVATPVRDTSEKPAAQIFREVARYLHLLASPMG
ncbi:hypothetical protein GE09DRAFT_480647 [Coniochaeta sp. 2T2.1]|nr:hypothetical protein GE09DRAFT_480647 [Coniochaeta sp. 2T2.1]